jgi:hypothetical protein
MRNLCAGLLLIAATTTVHASLEARDLNGDSVIDAYYDTVQNLSFTSDANLPATQGIVDPAYNIPGGLGWNDAMAWAGALDVFGVTGWRLPKLVAIDCSDDPHICFLDTARSELSLLSDFAPFSQVEGGPYWLSSFLFDDLHSHHAIVFNVAPREHGATDELGLPVFAWAVHDGDVAAVPEASTWALMLGGLAALGSASRARRP